MRYLIFSLVLLGFLSSASAAVTTPEMTLLVTPELPVAIPIDFDSTTTIAGINGQLNYDPAKFSNPTLEAPNSSFIFAGNEVSPGQYRFVVYKNPTAPLSPFYPALYIKLRAATGLVPGSVSSASYSMTAASDMIGNSLSGVAFGALTLKTAQFRNSAGAWSMYD